MTAPPATDDRASSTTEHGEGDRRVGELIAGRYRLITRLGEGAMGTVYLARHEGLQREVAVKFLQEEFTGNREIAARFAREAIAAARIQHPNVIAVHDSGTDAQGRCYLVMEYVGGDLLRAVMERGGALPRDRALALARQIAAALDHAHALGIVHRDIKPENVLVLDVQGVETVKVIDFGIAKIFHPEGPSTPGLTRGGIVLGTPEYMAPEQAAGTEIDHRADVYALAVMVYEMLVGSRPFDSDDVMALLMAHLTAAPPPPSTRRPDLGFGAAVDEVFARALAKSPAARPARASEFVDQLTAALLAPVVVKTPTDPAPPATPDPDPTADPAPPSTAVPAPDPTSPRGGLSRRARFMVGGGLLAVTLAGLGLASRAPPDGPPPPAIIGSSPPASARGGTEGRAAATDDRSARLDALRARPDLGAATPRDRQAAARTLEALRTQSPDDPAVAFVLGTVYAQDRATHPLALVAYRDAVQRAPELGSRAPLVDDVVRVFATTPALAGPAGELLRGPLAAVALDTLVDAFLRGGPGRARLAGLLDGSPFAARLDATSRGLIALAGARSCEAKRPVVEALGRDADARALPALRRIPIGSGCGFLGLGTCNSCLGGAIPAAIRAIEARAADAGSGARAEAPR